MAVRHPLEWEQQAATPHSAPSGLTFFSPVSVQLASAMSGSTILYTVDGTTPSTSVDGTTNPYAGNLLLSATTTIKAIAVQAGYSPSAVMTEHFTYAPPARVENSWDKDTDGDGRIETAVLVFPFDLNALPEMLGFSIREDRYGATFDRYPGPGEIAFEPGSRSRVIANLSEPFPFGVTSIPNSDSSGRTYGQPGIPMPDGVFRISDSIPPVVIHAAYLAESDSDYVPMAGDSVALNPEGAFSDLFANAPAKAVFFPLTGDFPSAVAAGPPRAFKRDSDWVLSGRTLSGKGLSLHPPRSIACHDLEGDLLGIAKPTASSDVWELSAGKQAMVLILEMPNGARRGINIPP